MKRFTLFLVFGVFVCMHSYAQWVAQTAPVTFEARGGHMVSSHTGYIAGSDGNMLKTTDAGTTWTSISSGTTDTLRAVFFINQNTGFIVGAQGTISRTDDGGNSWVPQTSGVTNLLRSVYFVTASTGYICGGGGVILKTIDGGNNWMLLSSGTTNDLINIRFTDVSTGYVVSSLSTFLNGFILKTSDGGNTWNQVYADANGLLGLAVKGNVIYAGGGYQVIVKSIDAGATWTQVNAATATANHFRSAAFISADTGFVAGDAGMIYYTSDGGTTWTDQGINISGVLSVFIYNKDTIFACGTSGDILRYTTSCIPAQAVNVFGNTIVCANDTMTFFVTPVPGTQYYKWQVPGNATILSGLGSAQITVHFGTTSGFVSVADSNLCGSSAYTQVAVTVNPLPPVPTITQNLGTLVSSSATGNQWYFNGILITGATGQNYAFTQNGTYRVKVTLPTGCSSISAPYTVTNVGIGVPEAGTSQISIMPNPVKQSAELGFRMNKAVTAEISVYDILGNRISTLSQKCLAPGRQSILLDCSSFSPGLYFVKLELDQVVYYRRFIKE